MTFTYSPWRHGGWYVNEVRYPSGATGCVSRNYRDRKWRIVCDERLGDHTYPNRNAAAAAEYAIAQAKRREVEHEPQGETVRLFEPAPNQIPGQTHIAV